MTDSIYSALIGADLTRQEQACLVKEGLLVSARERQETMNCIANGHIEMPRTCYYSARTVARDIAAKEAATAAREDHEKWLKETHEGRASAEAQMEAFARQLMSLGAPAPSAPQLPGDVIDGCISEVSPANDTAGKDVKAGSLV